VILAVAGVEVAWQEAQGRKEAQAQLGPGEESLTKD